MSKLYLLKQFYIKRDYTSILNIFENDLSLEYTDASIYLGMTLFKLGYIKESLIYLDLNKDIDSFEKEQVGLMLGLYNYSIGNYNKSLKNFRISNAHSDNTKQEASRWMNILFPKDMYILKSSKINFYFDKNLNNKDISIFLDKYEKSYRRITGFYPSRLQKKIDTFVFKERMDQEKNKLSFSNPFLKTIHVNYKDEDGHELTHIITQNLNKKNVSIYKFVNEGIAEVFNLVKYRNFYEENRNIESILDLWEEYDLYNPKYVNAISKIFLTQLKRKGDKENFISITLDQSIENFKKNYGSYIHKYDLEIITNLKKFGLNKCLDFYDC